MYGDSIKKGSGKKRAQMKNAAQICKNDHASSSTQSLVLLVFESSTQFYRYGMTLDFGYNDGGGKIQVQRDKFRIGLFKRFFDIKENDPRYSQKGLYGSWLFGGPDRLVHVIVLDLRCYKSEWRCSDPHKDLPFCGAICKCNGPVEDYAGRPAMEVARIQNC